MGAVRTEAGPPSPFLVAAAERVPVPAYALVVFFEDPRFLLDLLDHGLDRPGAQPLLFTLVRPPRLRFFFFFLVVGATY